MSLDAVRPARIGLFIAAALYGTSAVAMLATLLIVAMYGPPISAYRGEPLSLSSLVVAAINSAICGLISYGLLRLRNWSRYLVIAFNGLYIAGFVSSFVWVLVLEPGVSVSPVAILFVIIFTGTLGGVIALVLRRDVKAMMMAHGQ